MFNKAKEWGKASRNPALKVKLLKEENRRTRYLEKEEIRALLDACSEHLKPIVVTALNTGVRKSEILNLKWPNIDLRQRMYIFIRQRAAKAARLTFFIAEWTLFGHQELREEN